jgi:hypothetical protein
VQCAEPAEAWQRSGIDYPALLRHFPKKYNFFQKYA